LYLLHRVADEILGCSVDELNDRLTYEAFIKWVAYLKLKDERFEKWEWYAAHNTYVQARLAGNKNTSLKDFTLRHSGPTKVKPSTLLQMIATATGAEIDKNG